MKSVAMRLKKDFQDYKIGIFIFTVYYVVVHAVFRAFCPLVMLTGLPCAGCGMTRALFFFVAGQFLRSWRLNPMALPVLLFFVYGVITRYILGKRVKGFRVCVAIFCLCMLVIYVYRMCTVFPNQPPYVYTAGNFLEKSFPFYREILHKLLGI